MTEKRQLAIKAVKSFTAILCVSLLLVFTAVEATHAHSTSRISGISSGCALCVSVHANAPALSAFSLETLITVELLAVPCQSEGKDFTRLLSLFIRPPPLA